MQANSADFEKSLASVLSWWDVGGVETPALAPAKAACRKAPARAPLTQAKPAPKSSAPPVTAPSDDTLIKAASDMAAGAKTLDALRAAIEGFNAGALSDSARQAVVSRGNPAAEIMVIGEAPGQNEDAAGQPFVGPAGQFLDTIFASIDLNEETLYLTNVCNWRPPSNRKPTEAELAICAPIIRRHIELKAPKLIVLIGGVSMSVLTGLKGITKCRGKWEEIDIGGKPIPALITYHPAYLLRQPHLKRDVWRDMLSLKAKNDGLG